MNINSKKMIKQALVQLYASQAAVFVDKLFAFFFIRQKIAKTSALFITQGNLLSKNPIRCTLLILIPIRHIRTRTFTH